jgi:Protein of unknown function (DUF3829)
MNFLPAASTTIVVLTLLLGCACKKSREETAVATRNGSEKAAAAADTDEAFDTKMSAYIECFNETHQVVDRAMERYASWIEDLGVGPTGKERNVYGVPKIDESYVAKCTSAAKLSTSAPALGALDDAAKAYAAALQVAQPKVEELSTYYDREDYKDDKLAKGKKQHQSMWAALVECERASDRFSAAIEKENDKRLEKELAQVEKELGQKLLWHKMVAGKLARQLLKPIEGETFDVTSVEQQLSRFSAHVDATVAYAKAHPDEVPPRWSAFENTLNGFLNAAKERMRRVRDRKPYSNGEKMNIEHGTAHVVSGHPAKVGRTYNEMVTDGNALSF